MAATRRTSIERILCPIDFSDISHHALAHAAAVARWYEARLTLLYVFVNLPALDLPPLVLEDGDRARLFGSADWPFRGGGGRDPHEAHESALHQCPPNDPRQCRRQNRACSAPLAIPRRSAAARHLRR